jgi:hypothetical protein
MNYSPNYIKAQAARVADYLGKHTGSTAEQISTELDTGFGLRKGWRRVTAGDGRTRAVRTYALTQRPPSQPAPSPKPRALRWRLNELLQWIKYPAAMGAGK